MNKENPLKLPSKLPFTRKIDPKPKKVEAPPLALKRKRKEYDVKGRLQDLEEMHSNTNSDLIKSNKLIENMTLNLDQSKSTINDLLLFKQSLLDAVNIKEKEKSILSLQLETTSQSQKSLIDAHRLEIETLVKSHQQETKSLSDQITLLSNQLSNVKIELEGEKTQVGLLKSSINTMNAASFAVQSELQLYKSNLSASEIQLSQLDKQIIQLETEKLQFQNTIKELENEKIVFESVRRTLHNSIQELKGNIRVFCRMRPTLESDVGETVLSQTGACQITFSDQEDIELRQFGDSASGKQISKPYNFTFDKVFQPTATQKQVFDDLSQLVQSALDGYNVCIFAYGQTGSGKTFTMEGCGDLNTDDSTAGMIPRAVNQIYTCCENLKDKGWNYSMSAQYLEIYNETLRDLLDSSDVSKKMDIKHDLKNKTNVTGATVVKVDSPQMVFGLLKKASLNRAVAATNCNERSSRSHSVFTLTLLGTNSVTGETCEGVLNLIDLAGSERLSSSGSVGDRLKETQAINKSLSSLGDVIAALANKDAHIPYRNSKLTWLLQNSLGGNSKTLMFVNVSPLSSSFNETLCSLRFATKVNSCQIGTARKQISFK